MGRADHDYLQELTVHLRLAGLNGRAAGAILEETRDHLQASGEAAEDAFGPAEAYAAALVRSHSTAGTTPRMRLTRMDLVAGAAQLAGWLLLVSGLVGSMGGSDVVILPGHLAGWALLTFALVWPVWPAVEAYLAGRRGVAIPTAAMTAVILGWVLLTIVWDAPELAALASWVAISAGVAVIALCWLRVWRLRDPILRPTHNDDISRANPPPSPR
jgi:hypothetical protein